MTTPLAIADIERMLRTPPPDEPAVLPSLALPGAGYERVAFRIARRTGTEAPEAQRLRLLVAVVAMLALLAAIVGAGALRLLDRPDDPLAEACLYVPGQPYDLSCLPVAVPDGWTVLGAGQMFPGDFTEDGIGYEYVKLVMASAPLGGCPSPGGPMPTDRPIGSNAFEQPYPTPDPGLWCLRAAPLPQNGVRIEAMYGQRISGLADAGYGIPDTSEPTEAAGWDEVVAGRPARLTVSTRSSGGVETRTWDILLPGSIDQVLRIRADISGPDFEAGRAQAQSVVDSTHFDVETPPLDESAANDVLASLLDELDRTGRAARTDYFGCFPREPGGASGTISGGPSAPLGGPLAVTCTSAIEPSRAGLWRVTLTVSWPPADGQPGDTIQTEYFATGAGAEASPGIPAWSGGYMTSLSGRPFPEEGVEAWFPTAQYELPPVLTGPMDLPVGSIVAILWPGESTAASPGAGDGSSYPGSVGLHAYVLAGPVIVDGEEWYQVQAPEGGIDEQVGWLRGTRDGRPQLAVVEPACPDPGDVTVGEITWLIAAERLTCIGDRQLTVAGTLTRSAGEQLGSCEVVSPTEGCSSSPGQPEWLGREAAWVLSGPEGPSGPEPGLPVWLDPSAPPPPAGAPLRVTGHFDDGRARGCQLAFVAIGPYEPDPVVDELVCRERFVVTAIEPAG